MSKTRHWTREALRAAMDDIWGQYLPALARLPEAEQTRYANQQGYARVQDLLAHINAWAEETLRVMPYLLRNEPAPRDYANDDEFNARAVEHCKDWTRAQVEAEFERLRVALAELIASLPDEAFETRRVYRWVKATVVDHYLEHQLPNGPALR